MNLNNIDNEYLAMMGDMMFSSYIRWIILLMTITLPVLAEKDIVISYSPSVFTTKDNLDEHIEEIYWMVEGLYNTFDDDITFEGANPISGDDFNNFYVEWAALDPASRRELEAILDYQGNDLVELQFAIKNILQNFPPTGVFQSSIDALVSSFSFFLESNVTGVAAELDNYQKLLDSNKCVVIISHGTGVNLANKAYNRFESEVANGQIQIISIAPTSPLGVAGNSPTIGLFNDKFVPPSLTTTQENTETHPDLIGGMVSDPYQHHLYTYLYGNETGTLIRAYLVSAIDRAKEACSKPLLEATYIGGGITYPNDVDWVVKIDIKVNRENKITGYLDADGVGGRIVCGAGDITGVREGTGIVKDGDVLKFSYDINDPDFGCGPINAQELSEEWEGTLSQDLEVLEGIFITVENGNYGPFRALKEAESQ